MLIEAQSYIPILTSKAGSCLTPKNWQEVKVTAASYSLECLLHKPGYDVLRNIKVLSEYLAWPGGIILNAMSLVTNKEGVYVLKSPYDGSKVKHTFFEIMELLHWLKPEIVLLPKKSIDEFLRFENNWNNSIMPFFHADDLEKQKIKKAHGIYFDLNGESKCNGPAKWQWEDLNRWSHLPRYILGAFNPELVQGFVNKEIEFIETDEPANAAMQGIVYSKEGIVDLMNPQSRMQFTCIDKDCACPTCSQQLTRAYLHHLLRHTPLLCQRFLIQHNAYYVRNCSN